jgi:hypothetical protein
MNMPPAKLPQDDTDAKLMRFEGIRGQRYTEIFLIDADGSTGQLIGGVYNTVGLNDPDGSGDTRSRRGHHHPRRAGKHLRPVGGAYSNYKP